MANRFLESAVIDDDSSHPNEVIIRAKYGYIEIGGFSSSKRQLLAELILKALTDE